MILDPCLVIRTGDWVRVDANPQAHGLIEVKPGTVEA